MARVFISYSHRDKPWLDKIRRQLGVLGPQGLEVWEDSRIAAGDDWQPEIERAMDGCDVALLLISAAFLNSRFILGKEVPALLQRRQEEGLRVIPVILSACAWQRITWLNPIQARLANGKPLAAVSKPKADQALAALVTEIHDHAPLPPRGGGAGGEGAAPATPPKKITLTHLPAGAPHFLGRASELAALDQAWDSQGRTAIVELIAPGGTGKTALIKRWVDTLKATHWRGAEKVFAWSFYSQGTSVDRQASEDHFLAQAIEWFDLDIAPALNPADKGQKLAEAVAASRTLLILDGLEPLQYPPGPLAGGLRAPGVRTLLTHLATAGHAGLCVVTSQEWLKDLDEWVRRDNHPDGAVLRIDLGNLSANDGARLLHQSGANKAGAVTIAPDDSELIDASHAVKGHALTLTLLGYALAVVHDGDIRQRDKVDFADANRVMAGYKPWPAGHGEAGSYELAALRLLCFFDRPAPVELLAVLREAPAIPGLTEALQDIGGENWNVALTNLADRRLVELGADGGLVAPPLVRAYFAAALKKHQPEAWREGHRRLYEHLKSHTPYHPDTLEGLQPLYQAVAHGCQAGLHQDACDEVYFDRIQRGTGTNGYYSIRKLGAFGADLSALAEFFIEPWRQLVMDLKAQTRSWLLYQVAFRLRALGRLTEALEPMQAAEEMAVRHKDWNSAARYYGDSSELHLSLGRVADAIASAESAVDYASRSGDAFQYMARRATLANARHQGGEVAAARAVLAEAEAMQAERQFESPLFYSLRGFQYCDLLLAEAEGAAWRGSEVNVALADARKPNAGGVLGFERQPNLQLIEQVATRTTQTLPIAERNAWLLDIALDHLTLARCALYADCLQARPPGTVAQHRCHAAVTGLRAAGQQDYLPLGLLTHAWLCHALRKPSAAQADLAEAHRIAARGGMRLHLADIALTRARLFRDKAQLAEARRLIEECGYGRRLPELEDAERSLGMDGEIAPEKFIPPPATEFTDLSPEETLTLAFHLVLTGAASPDLLSELNPAQFREALWRLPGGAPSASRLRELLAGLASRQDEAPHPLWLAWASTVHGARVDSMAREMTMSGVET